MDLAKEVPLSPSNKSPVKVTASPIKESNYTPVEIKNVVQPVISEKKSVIQPEIEKKSVVQEKKSVVPPIKESNAATTDKIPVESKSSSIGKKPTKSPVKAAPISMKVDEGSKRKESTSVQESSKRRAVQVEEGQEEPKKELSG